MVRPPSGGGSLVVRPPRVVRHHPPWRELLWYDPPLENEDKVESIPINERDLNSIPPNYKKTWALPFLVCAHAAFLRCCSRYLAPLRIEPEFSINRHCNANTLASGCHAIRSVIMNHQKNFRIPNKRSVLMSNSSPCRSFLY